ncbi:cell division protein PerM [Naasia aerilata]|uniref:Integral membrane protein n=1 Tax=Naasia aerilata TaxID=1162966 RepID=A0ABM8G9S1_9MICO|nr:DUF6350 family protein [Naasia aerilata]BDZ44951.1 hypothetical protein GCM10025866_08600 [Naasia aerilata]
MNRPVTALLAALESLLTAGIGLGALLVPLTALWAFQYELGVDWAVFYRAAADTWLLGHGVDVRFVLDPALATRLALAGAGNPFVVTVGALGLGLTTAVLAARTGARLRASEHPRLGALVAMATFAAVSALVVLTAGAESAQPSRWQGVLLPTAVFTVGLAGGWLLRRNRHGEEAFLLRVGLPVDWAVLLREGARAGLASLAVLLAVSAVAVAALLVLGYSTVISLYEALQGDVLGGAALTLGQLAVLPDLVIWAAAWLLGPGFALGAGSSVSPLGTAVGPLPGLPVLGALPAGDFGWGFLGLLLPVVGAFLVGALLRPRIDRALLLPAAAGELLVAAGIAALTGGLAMGLLASAASGAAGPGRLASVGPDPLLVGLLAGVEFGIGAALGLLSGRRRGGGEQSERAYRAEEARR